MRTVNIAELKNSLSRYVGYAKAGEEIVVRDRNKPVARLVPYVAAELDAETEALVAAGLIRLPKQPWDMKAVQAMPIARMTGGQDSATRALLDERYADDAR